MIHRGDPLFEGLAPPDPSPELRQRVLAAAREALGQAESPDIWTRIWGNKAAHLAWSTSVGVLLFGHIIMGGAVSKESSRPAMPLVAATTVKGELAEVVGLQRISAELPGWEVGARGHRTHPDEDPESEDQS